MQVVEAADDVPRVAAGCALGQFPELGEDPRQRRAGKLHHHHDSDPVGARPEVADDVLG